MARKLKVEEARVAVFYYKGNADRIAQRLNKLVYSGRAVISPMDVRRFWAEVEENNLSIGDFLD